MSSRISLTTKGHVSKHICPIAESPRLVERVKLHIKSPILFDRQLCRPGIASTNAHESRFTIINDNPVISSKHKRVVSPVFSKALGRKNKKRVDIVTEYTPNLEVIKDHSGAGSPKWQSKQGRKPFVKPVNALTYDLNYASVDRKSPVPLFDKGPPRRGFS